MCFSHLQKTHLKKKKNQCQFQFTLYLEHFPCFTCYQTAFSERIYGKISLCPKPPDSLGKNNNFTMQNIEVAGLLLQVVHLLVHLNYFVTFGTFNYPFKTPKPHNNTNKLTHRGSSILFSKIIDFDHGVWLVWTE